MITLPSGLEQFMKGQDLAGLKPFAVLFRNKWVDEESGSGSGTDGHYALDTDNPIDISDLIVKPNTLSMTLDVNEVAQYNCNNVTLTIADTKNRFIEGTPNSYFPAGYQLYGSRVVLYYGTDSTNRIQLFTGVIKELPTHKPEQYQVELKLVSPLEMLKDIEAKDFSDKVIGETLTFIETDSDGHKVYQTAGLGVGGFDGVYANGEKLFEGVDYEIEQLNTLGIPAIVIIINSDYYSDTITADYYTWKTNLTVEQIVAGLVGLAWYDSATEDIRNVVWNTSVRNQITPNLQFSIGYKKNGANLEYKGNSYFGRDSVPGNTTAYRYSKFPNNFLMSIYLLFYPTSYVSYFFGDIENGSAKNGYSINSIASNSSNYVLISKVTNGSSALVSSLQLSSGALNVTKQLNSIVFSTNLSSYTDSINFSFSGEYTEIIRNGTATSAKLISSFSLKNLDNNEQIGGEGAVFDEINRQNTTWVNISGQLAGNIPPNFQLQYRTSDDAVVWENWTSIDFEANISKTTNYIQFKVITLPIGAGISINNVYVSFLSSSLLLNLVNLSGKTVLEALQDFALISGYEFGVDRNGVFFFKPRVASTTPTYILGNDELTKVDTVKRNFSDFFTKLTLTFAQRPLEFYANSGPRPTAVDKYGIINKDIDKPDIVNYDNPELAQAIGPQLLEVYSTLSNIIQATGKLNLSLELGDIVSLRRNMNLVVPDSASEYTKYVNSDIYYRACKITGMNYNFAKRQIAYTLRDVSNENNMPQYEFNHYIYDFKVPFGVKE